MGRRKVGRVFRHTVVSVVKISMKEGFHQQFCGFKEVELCVINICDMSTTLSVLTFEGSGYLEMLKKRYCCLQIATLDTRDDALMTAESP